MPIRLDARAADFAEKFRAFLDTKREASADVEQAVRAIIADVAARGDAALIELTPEIRPRRSGKPSACASRRASSMPRLRPATAKRSMR